MPDAPRLRIGELSRRVGVSRDLLRAWERRYGLLRPVRSDNGFRLYSEVDEWRVHLMQEKLWSGLSAAEAARAVAAVDRQRDRDAPSSRLGRGPSHFTAELGAALEEFDEDRAHASLDRLFAVFGVERAIRDALMPYLCDLGERWARNEITVGQEHFVSRLLEGRLLTLARGWNRGPGPRAILACPPGEQHTLPLLGFGLALRSRGWRNIYLGADTPPSTVHMAADTVDANMIALGGRLDRPLPTHHRGVARAGSRQASRAGRRRRYARARSARRGRVLPGGPRDGGGGTLHDRDCGRLGIEAQSSGSGLRNAGSVEQAVGERSPWDGSMLAPPFAP